MTASTVALALLVLLVVVLAGVYLSWTAGRIDRLQVRVDAARAAVDAQLARRAAAAQDLAAVLLAADPADDDAQVLLLAARLSLQDAEGAATAASDLTRAARTVVTPLVDPADPPPEVAEALAELLRGSQRVQYARQFHNDAVRDTLVVRGRRIPRWLRLAGHAPEPEYFDIDDEPLASGADADQ